MADEQLDPNLKPLSQAGDERALARRLGAQYKEAKSAEATMRQEARKVRAFFDGEQWEPAVKAQLAEEDRPALVINKMHKVRNNLVGRQRDNRLSWKAYPIGPSDVNDSDIVTYVLKNLEDQTFYSFVESEAFYDMVSGPMGWIETGYDDSDLTLECIYSKTVDPFEMYLDPFGTQKNLRDHRFLIRTRWVDLDMAIANYPAKADALKAAVESEKDKASKPSWNDEQDYGNRILPGSVLEWQGAFGEPSWCDAERQRVKLREHWWWENVPAIYIKWPDGRVRLQEDLMAEGQQLVAQAAMEGAQAKQGTRRQYFYAIVAGDTLLEVKKSPYKHEHGFPYVPVWGYRDRYGRPFGPGKPMLDPQLLVNVNYSKAAEAIRAKGVFYETGAFGRTPADEVAARLSRPNFAIEVTKLDKKEVIDDAGLTNTWLQLASVSEGHVDDTIGFNEAAYGDQGNEQSGKAIERRVQQQNLTYGELFDNLRLARKIVGEILLSLVQQYYSPEKVRRLVETQAMKEGDSDLDWLDPALAAFTSQSRYDIKVDDQTQTATERQARMQTMVDLLPYVPEPAMPVVLPEVLRMADGTVGEQLAGKVEQALMMPPMMPGMPPAPGGGEGPPPGPPGPGRIGKGVKHKHPPLNTDGGPPPDPSYPPMQTVPGMHPMPDGKMMLNDSSLMPPGLLPS